MLSSLKNFFKIVYFRFPVIRELNLIFEALRQQNKILGTIDSQHSGFGRLRRIVECSSVIQAIELLKIGNERYRDPKRLLCHSAQYWSQNYEDGILEEIFKRVGITTKTFVEIGIGDGTETNTTALLSSGWGGFWFEADSNACSKIRDRLAQIPQIASRIKLVETFVAPSTIWKKFQEVGIPNEVDLFSLDIDLNTFHIWEALAKFRPRVVVVEYNAGISPNLEWKNSLNESEVWDGTQNFGASLKSFEILGRSLSYSLVGCDILGVNAFFVRNDLLREGVFCEPFTAENHYEPPRYHLLYRNSHPASIF
jgi:hypothetical protein